MREFVKNIPRRILICFLEIRIKWNFYWYKKSTERSSRDHMKLMELENELDFQNKLLK